jgi:tRNA threonylcarbamoyladenosine biosynthesis protein TsaE
MKIFRSFSSDETKRLGRDVAKSLITDRSAYVIHALVITLRGDLGAGKTTFTQGFFRGLGIKRNPTSPTFVIMRHYKVRAKRFRDIYHFDAYRLKKVEDLAVLKFEDILSDPGNMVLIEWPERIKEAIPKKAIRLDFSYGKKENERIIKMKSGLPEVLQAKK